MECFRVMKKGKSKVIQIEKKIIMCAIVGLITINSRSTLYADDISTYQVSNIQIVHQPQNIGVKAGDTVGFQVKAEGNGLKYQWQVKFAGENWKNASAASAKTASYTFTANSAHNGMQVRCVIKDQYGKQVVSKEVICKIAGYIEEWELPIM